ncbi:MAG: DUF2334 domain-containing protein [Lachnospiraceae bacterium]|nr:DUF2334 domain-containing protein [Lachnospiraceae bacterium]
MKVAVRLDDITPDMDWERFYLFKALLDKYQVKPLIGVVPDNRDENLRAEKKDNKENAEEADAENSKKTLIKDGKPADFWIYVKQLQREGYIISMHGFRHIYATKKGGLFPLNNFSEFAGLSYETQKTMLEEGKKILKDKGIETTLFMAPAHSYDKNTLKALRETGFTGLTDGFGDEPYEWKGLTFYPISFKLGSTFKKQSGYSTMVIHTGTVSENDLKKYEGYFRRKDVEFISYGEYLKQPAVKRSVFGRGKEFFMAKGKYLISKIKNA